VLAAKLDVEGEGKQRITSLLGPSGGLNLSAARILMLGSLQVQPPEGVLWLEQNDGAATLFRGQLPPGLVVLVAPAAQVRDRESIFHPCGGGLLMSKLPLYW
jgi:hypothetical protein